MSLHSPATRRNGLAHDPASTHDKALCPYCGQSITRVAFKKIKERIESDERARIAKVEQALKLAADAQISAAIEKERKAAAAKIKVIQGNQEGTINARLQAQRERLEKAAAEAVAAERLQHAGEKLRLETALGEMQRKLQAKPANAIGEPAEVDLHQQISVMLAETAPEDRVSRVPRGVRGADLVIEVIVGGKTAGKLIVESKNHGRWQSSFTRRLRENQIREDAAFAILSSSVFWTGAPQQIALRDGVICSAPDRVPVLVSLLRQIIADNFLQRLGEQERNSKADRLYSFILSRRCQDMLDGLQKLTRDLGALDTVETKAHQATWAKRESMIAGVSDIREQFVWTIADLVGGADSLSEQVSP